MKNGNGSNSKATGSVHRDGLALGPGAALASSDPQSEIAAGSFSATTDRSETQNTTFLDNQAPTGSLEIAPAASPLRDGALLEELCKTRPRESSGSRTSNRFDYQKSWAFCLLLKLHQAGRDYIMLLDFHDDVIVLDSSTTPTLVTFYQVKTKKTGNWTVSLLVKRDKGAEGQNLNSILGKMYSNKLAFPFSTESLNFVTNAQFRFALKDDPAKEIVVDGAELSRICFESARKFSKAIQQEHNLPFCPICDVVMRFTTDPLSLEDHATHAQGQLASFLSEIQPDGKFAVAAGFRAVTTAISRKSNAERQPKTPQELLSLKGISRAEFAQMLDTILSQNAEKERWQATHQVLTSENVPYGDIKRWRTAWRKYEIERMDASNTALTRIQEHLRNSIATIQRSTPSVTLTELVRRGLAMLEDKIGGLSGLPYDRDYLTAVILFEASED